MRILYAVQATGNGHLSRARELTPLLRQYAEVDIFVSGTQGDVQLPFEIDYKRYGFSFLLGKKGGIDFKKSLLSMKPIRLIKDIWTCPVEQYDIVINDFEPITAWACKLKNHPIVGVSHQAAFISDDTPRPKRQQWASEAILKYFAPAKKYIGFHFKSYDDFIITPLVRSCIRNAKVRNEGHVAVYLPPYGDDVLIEHFKQISNRKFIVFSKNTKEAYTESNVDVFPIDNDGWAKNVSTCDSVIMGAGFEGPSEALFLGKRLMVIPIQNQYEQYCNAAALKQMGVTTCKKIDENFAQLVKQWLEHTEPIAVNYPSNEALLIERLFDIKTNSTNAQVPSTMQLEQQLV